MNLSLKINFREIILLFFLFIAIFMYLLKSFFGSNVALGISVFIGSLLMLRQLSFGLSVFESFFLFFSAFGTIFIIINNGLESGKMFFPIIFSSLGISLTIFETIKKNNLFHLRFTLFIILFLFIYLFIYFLFFGNLEGSFRGSRNQVSINLLLFLPYFYLVREINNLKVSLLIPFFVFLLSILAVGSSGIISSAILFFGILFLNNKKIFLQVFIFLGLFLILFIDILPLDPELFTKLSIDRFFNDERFVILSEYIKSLDFLSFFLGKPLSSLVWVFPLETLTNPHNSYLLLHAKIGIIFYIYLCFLFYILMKLWYVNKIFLVLFISILLRAFTDTIAFSHGYYEWSIVLIYLYVLKRRKLSV